MMIDPPAPSAMRMPTTEVRRNGPFRLTPMTLSKRSSLTSSRLRYRGDMPALLTSTSTVPNSL